MLLLIITTVTSINTNGIVGRDVAVPRRPSRDVGRLFSQRVRGALAVVAVLVHVPLDKIQGS